MSTTDSRGKHTGTWSLDRPVLTAECNACALCALFCPEGAISRTDGAMAIDYLYCKGCGICEVVCPVRNAIAMEEVPASSGGSMTANEAAAHAVMLARVRAIACYPITPQTLIVEKLADLVAGRDDIEFANLESEHSMFGYAIAAARTGVRTFTATSSQGLLYAHEQLHRASRERVPLVIVNVNRAVFAPWSLEPDLTDSMSQRDTGWIQLYCSSAQEVLDSILCAYRIAETVLLPVMVCAEGFLLSHTSEVLDVPDQDAVDAFIPELRPPDDWLLDPDRPRAFSALAQPKDYYAFQRNVADAMDERERADRRPSRRSSRRTSGARRSARSRSPAIRARTRRSSRSGRSATPRTSCSTPTTTCSSSACMRTGRSRRRSSRPRSQASPTSR